MKLKTIIDVKFKFINFYERIYCKDKKNVDQKLIHTHIYVHTYDLRQIKEYIKSFSHTTVPFKEPRKHMKIETYNKPKDKEATITHEIYL